MRDDEVRLLRRLRNDVEPLLRDGGLTIGQIMERLMDVDHFYRNEISAERLHMAVQLMARIYDRDFCRTHRSSTKIWLIEHPNPPAPIKPVTARAGATRASRIAEALDVREMNSGNMDMAIDETVGVTQTAATDRPTIREN